MMVICCRVGDIRVCLLCLCRQSKELSWGLLEKTSNKMFRDFYFKALQHISRSILARLQYSTSKGHDTRTLLTLFALSLPFLSMLQYSHPFFPSKNCWIKPMSVSRIERL